MHVYRVIKRYRVIGLIYLIKCWILTKLFYPNARLIRFPFDCRNFHQIYFGKNFTTGRNCRIEVESLESQKSNEFKLIFGDNVQLNDNVHITASKLVKIGNNVLIASKVYISDCSHGKYKNECQSSYLNEPSKRELFSEFVIIEDNVWIGDGVCILPGVTIGYGSIIGANSVVTKDIPAKSIAVGIPSIVIKEFNTITNNWEKV